MNDRSWKDRLAEVDRQRLLPPNVGADGRSTTARRILEGALLLFARQGFHASSMRDLARVAELQASAIYVHFSSKEHILAELLRVGHEEHHASLRRAALDAPSDGVAQLRALVGAHVRMHAHYPHLAIVVSNELDSIARDLAGPAIALRNQSISLLMEVLARGASRGEFQMQNLFVTGAAVSAMGMRLPYWYSPETGITVDSLVDLHVDLALRMVGARA